MARQSSPLRRCLPVAGPAPTPTEPSDPTVTDPPWPLVSILGDIAQRIEGHRAAEHVLWTPDTRRTAGGNPAARTGEAA